MSITHSSEVQITRLDKQKCVFMCIISLLTDAVLSSLSPSVPSSLQVGLKKKAKDLL